MEIKMNIFEKYKKTPKSDLIELLAKEIRKNELLTAIILKHKPEEMKTEGAGILNDYVSVQFTANSAIAKNLGLSQDVKKLSDIIKDYKSEKDSLIERIRKQNYMSKQLGERLQERDEEIASMIEERNAGR